MGIFGSGDLALWGGWGIVVHCLATVSMWGSFHYRTGRYFLIADCHEQGINHLKELHSHPPSIAMHATKTYQETGTKKQKKAKITGTKTISQKFQVGLDALPITWDSWYDCSDVPSS